VPAGSNALRSVWDVGTSGRLEREKKKRGNEWTGGPGRENRNPSAGGGQKAKEGEVIANQKKRKMGVYSFTPKLKEKGATVRREREGERGHRGKKVRG